jgi:hypothetical protein
MSFLSWFLKFIVFPLIPMVAGSILQIVNGASFGISIINPAQLSFSTAMVCLFVSTRTTSLTDPQLKKGLNLLFQISLYGSLILFAWSLYVQQELYSEALKFCADVSTTIGKNGAITLKECPATVAHDAKVLDLLRPIVIFFSLACLAMATFVGVIYDLDKD